MTEKRANVPEIGIMPASPVLAFVLDVEAGMDLGRTYQTVTRSEPIRLPRLTVLLGFFAFGCVAALGQILLLREFLVTFQVPLWVKLAWVL